MAVIKIIDNPVNTDQALENLCEYIYEKSKIDSKYCLGCRGVLSPYDAYSDMKIVENVFSKTNGRHAYHITISFMEGTALIPDEAYSIAYEVSSMFFPNHIVLFSVHTKQKCLHIHFCIHTVDILGGTKLHFDFAMLAELQEYANLLEQKYLRM